jgi:hypothetical protein
VRDAALALAVGAGVAALVWQVLATPSVSISDYYLQTTRSLGGGANAVNVIIVDYRGFDTLGEITVLVIAALTIHACWRSAGAAGQPLPAEAAPTGLGPLAAAGGGTLPCCPLHCWCRCTSSCAATTCPAAASSPAWCWRWRLLLQHKVASGGGPAHVHDPQAGWPPACCWPWPPAWPAWVGRAFPDQHLRLPLAARRGRRAAGQRGGL